MIPDKVATLLTTNLVRTHPPCNSNAEATRSAAIQGDRQPCQSEQPVTTTAYEALNTNMLATLTLLESDNSSMYPSIVCSGLETTSHDSNTPPASASVDERNESPVDSLADEAEKQGGLQGSAHSEGNTAPVFSLEDNAASDTEASRGRHNATKNQIITSVAQLKGLLWEGRDKCGAHVQILEELKQSKEALKTFLLAPQVNRQVM